MTNVAKSTSFIATVGYDRNITMRIQSTSLGGLTLSPADMPARFSNIHYPGDKVQFDDLNVTFLLDEDFSEWVLLTQWIYDLSQGKYSQEPDLIFSSLEVTILDSDNQPTIRIEYQNCYPTTLSGVEMSVIDEEQTLTTSATFVYTDYKIHNVKTGEVIQYGRGTNAG